MSGSRQVALLGLFVALSAANVGAQSDCFHPNDPCPADAGAAISTCCPCDQRNHGQYVSCVVRFRNDLRQAECLDRDAQRQIARCAARSTCGKEGAVVCCFADTGDCSDTTPDGIATGTCSNDSDVACDTAADCTTYRGRVRRSEDRCTSQGGISVGAGSACTACDALTTTTTLP